MRAATYAAAQIRRLRATNGTVWRQPSFDFAVGEKLARMTAMKNARGNHVAQGQPQRSARHCSRELFDDVGRAERIRAVGRLEPPWASDSRVRARGEHRCGRDESCDGCRP